MAKNKRKIYSFSLGNAQAIAELDAFLSEFDNKSEGLINALSFIFKPRYEISFENKDIGILRCIFNITRSLQLLKEQSSSLLTESNQDLLVRIRVLHEQAVNIEQNLIMNSNYPLCPDDELNLMDALELFAVKLYTMKHNQASYAKLKKQIKTLFNQTDELKS